MAPRKKQLKKGEKKGESKGQGSEKEKAGSSEKKGRHRGRASRITVDKKLFKDAIKRAIAQPRLAFYSPIASCVLNYWKSVVPRFSISEFLARVVEKEIEKAWPQVYKMSVKELGKKIGTRKKKGRSSMSIKT